MDLTGAAYGFFANVALALAITWWRGGTVTLLPPPWRTAGLPAIWYRRPGTVAFAALAMMVLLNAIFR